MLRGLLVVGAGVTGGLIVAGIQQRRRRLPGPPPAHPLDPLAVEPRDDPDDAFTVLRQTHDELSGLAEELRDRRDAEAAERWVTASLRHGTAEEEELWPVVARRMEGGEGLARRAAEDELELRKVLQTLNRRHPGDVDWDQLIDRGTHLAYDRLVWEQAHVLPPLSRVLGAGERSELGRRLRAAAADAPTRPHLANSRLTRALDRVRS